MDGVWDITITENSGTYTITNFNSADNQCVTLGKINYNPRYHYLDSLVSYEFDITLKDLVMTDGKTLSDASSSNNYPSMMQGMVHFKDGTSSWTNNPVSDCSIAKRLNDGKTANGTFHICHEKIITNQACLTNASYYDLGFRFNYIKSGTITISNLHAYYQNLDTSTLSLSDNSAIGTHSAYFNGKNRINCGVVTPDYMDELTVSCWIYREDWTKITKLSQYSAIISNRDVGGFCLDVYDDNKQISLKAKIGDSYVAPNYFDVTTFSPGWHLVTGVATKNKISLYIDGELFSENNHNRNSPINNLYNNTTNKVPLQICSEIDDWGSTPKYTNMIDLYVDDVRLYSTALSPEDIKALYNVKTKIDNKSNLYCNQLVETKSENLVDYSLFEPGNYGGVTHSTSYKDGIYTMAILSNTSTTVGQQGPYFRGYEKNSLNHRPIVGKYYKLSMYVKVPKTGAWLIGSEVLPFKQKQYEAGKWYYIEQEGNASNGANAIIFYIYDAVLNVGDEIQIRDFQMYRLYDDENYNPGPNIKGQYKTFELNETFNEDVENSGATIIDKYGAEWLRVFHHNNKSGTILFENENEALYCTSENKFSRLRDLENFRGKDGKFEFLLEWPEDYPSEYIRWKQSKNPLDDNTIYEIDTNSYLIGKVDGYEEIYNSWYNSEQRWAGLLRNQHPDLSLLDGIIGGHWYYAIGAYQSYAYDDNNVIGVPGPEYKNQSGKIATGPTELYVRIDNLPNRNEIFRQYKRQTKTKEIIEI